MILTPIENPSIIGEIVSDNESIPYQRGFSMGYAAKVIALDDVRASHQRQALRQQLHQRFDQWLDALERQLPEAEWTLHQVSETIWGLRQSLTASVAQTLVEHRHDEERRRTHLPCATCARRLKGEH